MVKGPQNDMDNYDVYVELVRRFQSSWVSET